MKRPNTPGKWDWHQDYPYWYDEGCLWPKMLTCTVAVDRNDPTNGCLKLCAAPTFWGRVNHVKVGEAVAFDPQRLKLVLEQCPLDEMIMEPGDAVFFHGNTLHASGPNLSDRPRTLLHCSYNAIANSPFIEEGQQHHLYKPFEVLPDNVCATATGPTCSTATCSTRRVRPSAAAMAIGRSPAAKRLTWSEP